jgi:GTP-binding protein YchF
LVRGASKGEGLGNQFLANIRECAAILEVVRCFDDENITHVHGSCDPVRDAEIIETELILADLQTVEKRLEKTRKAAKADRALSALILELENLQKHLGKGLPASAFETPDTELLRGALREMALLSAKKTIYCANVDENSLAHPEKTGHAAALAGYAARRGRETLVVCAKIEEELQGLPDEEQDEVLRSYGIAESGLELVVRDSYKILDLLSFFTAGPKEVRAWTIPAGSRAPQAAGTIHSDFERGFIRAEVIAFTDYIRLGSEAAARASGLLRVEGRDYVLKDGDVVHFLFNV